MQTLSLKYAFLVLSIIVIFIIFYRQYNFGQRRKEYMTGIGSCGSLDHQDAPQSCSNNYTESNNLPLREYSVKACFNSAYDTNTGISIENLKNRIAEGYRFIDLNVFYGGNTDKKIENDVYVEFSSDNAPTLGNNTLLLSDALTAISDNAFSRAGTSSSNSMKNVNDYPIFVHLRVYSAPTDKGPTVDIIKKVANVIAGVGSASPPSYTAKLLRNSANAPEQINGCTNLSSIMGKMIFSMDILNILEIYAPATYPFASTIPPETIAAMQTYVNILSGGSTFPAFYRYTEESITSRTNKLGIADSAIQGSFKTNTRNMYISFPHPDDVSSGTGAIQPDFKSFMLDKSIQFIPMRVYLTSDPNKFLADYIKMFNDIGTPFAPMFYVYKYLN